VAGVLAAAAIFVGFLELVYRPFRLTPVALVVAMIAALMSAEHKRLVAAAVIVIGVCFVVGASLAVALDHKLY
jgi:hypothetical protein